MDKAAIPGMHKRRCAELHAASKHAAAFRPWAGFGKQPLAVRAVEIVSRVTTNTYRRLGRSLGSMLDLHMTQLQTARTDPARHEGFCKPDGCLYE